MFFGRRLFAVLSVGWQAIAKYLAAAHIVAVLQALVPGIALNGIDKTALALLHDAHMVAVVVRLPVEKDNITGAWLVIPILPLAERLKPAHASIHALKARDHSGVEETALIGAPRHIDRAPRHTARIAVPAPVRLTSLIAHLRQGYLHDGLIAAHGKGAAYRIVPQHMGWYCLSPYALQPIRAAIMSENSIAAMVE